MVEGIWVRACGDYGLVDVDGLESLQALVGGFIEGCQVYHGDSPKALMTVYWNEEGKFAKGAQINHAITHFLHFGGVLRDDDVIVGDCVVLGPLDDEGNETSVTEFVKEMMQHGVEGVNRLVQAAYDDEFSKIVKSFDKPARKSRKKKRGTQ